MLYVSIDSETRLIEAGRLDPDLVCITVCDQDTFEPELYDHFEAEEVILGLLEHPDVVFITANGAYDFAVFMRRYPALTKLIFAAYRAGRILDIQLAQRLIDIANGELDGTYNHLGLYVKHFYSLAALHERWGLGSLAKTDTFRLRFGELIELRKKDYPEGAKKYALDDAVAPLKVWLHQKESFPHFLKDLEAQSRAAFALHLMSVRGVHTDAQACDEYLQATKDEIEGYRKLLVDNKLLREKDGSKDTKAAKALMIAACERAGVKPKATATGGISLDAEACRDVGDPILKAYAAFTSAKSTLARVEKLKLGSGEVPLQSSFISLVNNGRTASREPSAGSSVVGLNLQNLPRGGMSRQVFIPRKGYKLNSVDFPGAELHTFAQVEKWVQEIVNPGCVGRSLIGDALNAKKDLHCVLAAAVLGCTYEECYANRKTGEYKRMRQLCKSVNFGMLAYMGAQRLMDTINKGAKTPAEKIDIQTAYMLRQMWLETWKTQPYFDYVQQMLASSGLATVEQFVSGRVRGRLSFTELANTWFSGLAADAFKAALWAVTEACYVQEDSALFGSRPLLPVHDEIIAELVDGPNLAAAAWEQARLMSETFSTYTPDYPIFAKPALQSVWFKAAEDVVDADGVLRCWVPQTDDPDFGKGEGYLRRALALCAA